MKTVKKAGAKSARQQAISDAQFKDRIGKFFLQWLEMAPNYTLRHNMKIEVSLDRDEWLAVQSEAKRLDVSIQQMCGALVSRGAENLCNGDGEFTDETIDLYVEGLPKGGAR